MKVKPKLVIEELVFYLDSKDSVLLFKMLKTVRDGMRVENQEQRRFIDSFYDAMRNAYTVAGKLMEDNPK